MFPRLLVALCWSFFVASASFAQTCGSLPYTLTNGTTADASQVMANLNHVLSCANKLADATEGRLTLASGTPVTTTDQTAKTALYYTPYKGNRISLYDGSANWNTYAFSELSIAVPSTSNQMYDVFVYANSGTATLELVAWTNATTRATALATQDGRLVLSGATTRRYMGSFSTTGTSGETEDSLTKRYVWNYYNRVVRPMVALEGTSTWTYTTNAFRQANANSANQLDFVIGVSEDAVVASVSASARNTAGPGAADMVVGIGLDSTSSNSATVNGSTVNPNASVRTPVTSQYKGFPGVGRHFLAWLEFSDATGSTLWFGTGGAYTRYQAGIIGEVRG